MIVCLEELYSSSPLEEDRIGSALWRPSQIHAQSRASLHHDKLTARGALNNRLLKVAFPAASTLTA